MNVLSQFAVGVVIAPARVRQHREQHIHAVRFHLSFYHSLSKKGREEVNILACRILGPLDSMPNISVRLISMHADDQDLHDDIN